MKLEILIRIVITVALLAGCVVLRQMNQRAQAMNERLDITIQAVKGDKQR